MESALTAVAAFFWLVPGTGLPLARWLHGMANEERFACVLFGGVLGLYLGAETLHLLGASPAIWLSLSAISASGWWLGRGELVVWSRDPAVREAALGWLGVTAFSVFALTVIRTYSGGDWIGDWVGHWHRAHFFLYQNANERWIFLLDPFTARPPLLNLATAAILAHTSGDFAAYQVTTTLLGCLATIPIQLLAKAAGGRTVARWAGPLLMVSPLFIENATYSWTKLESAAFVLAGIFFYVRACTSDQRRDWLLSALALTGGVLGHYSAVPYLLLGAAGYFWRHRESLSSPEFWGQTCQVSLATVALASTWFGWALASHGWNETLGANTSVQQFHTLDWSQRLTAFALNLEHTLFPPPWPASDALFLQHRNAFATLRDEAFVFYQTCLPGMIGFGGIVVFAAGLLRVGRSRLLATKDRRFAWLAAVALVVLCIAVHPARVRWGVGHICLQPAALAITAVGGAIFTLLPSHLRWLAMAGYFLDAVLGVALHLKVEHAAVPIEQLAAGDGTMVRELYGLAFQQNTAAKFALGLELLGERGLPPIVAGVLMALVLGLAIYGAFTADRSGAVARGTAALPSSRPK